MARIVHIEDDPANRLLVRKLLSRAGHEVVDAADGIEGIRLACSVSPDLVLVDLNIPGLDGFEVTLRLRGEAGLRGVPIVRHDDEWGMVYRSQPPYDLVENDLITAADMERVSRFARYWERIWNSGRFAETAPLLIAPPPSAFQAFLRLSDWLNDECRKL